MLSNKFTSLKNFIRIFKNWPRAIMCWYSSPKGYAVLKMRDGTRYKVRCGKSDIQMIIEIYAGKSYHRYLEKLPEKATIIDIGANIGAFTLFISKYTAGKSTVFSFEPFPDNFNILEENLKLNNVKNVKPFRVAVAGANEERSLSIDSSDNAMHSFFTDSKEKIPVQTTTLENIFKDNNIDSCDFLKIDCEGAEYEIILNTPVPILEKINIISIEFHYSPYYNHTDITKFLKASGFKTIVFESETNGFGFIDAIRN